MTNSFRLGDMIHRVEDHREGWIVAIRDAGRDEDAGDGPEVADESWDCRVEWEDGTQGEVLLHDLEVVTARIFVNVFLCDRAYGGPEEGGWWYDVKNVVKCLRCKDEEHASAVFERTLLACAEANKYRRSDVGSVNSEGRFKVELDAWPAEKEPSQKPHYC